jgi:3-hydroxyacyl-CoA dehydrogenase/enoyl-CoA hydratase/3-hydroxybutyryl-CoA epimerase
VLSANVEAGKLGKKTGQGIYTWVDGKAQKQAPDPYGPELIEKLIRPYLTEAQRVLDEGIVAEADLVDAGLIFGTGFAPFRGGPLHYVAHGKATSG